MPGPAIRFFEDDRPSLQAGAYTLQIDAYLASGQAIPAQTLSSTTRRFTVAGPRFQLDPAAVAAVFPPDDTQGGYADVLPHALLSGSTLPWQRTAQAGSDRPWLAVLAFAEDEAPTPKSIPVRDLAAPGFHGPAITLEAGESPDDLVAVIDVRWGLLRRVLPSYDDLPLLTHVRQPLDATGSPDGDPVAIVAGNRLPLAGRRNVVFLVSVEDRYGGGHFQPTSLGDGDEVRLVMLRSWAFESGGVAQDFIALLSGVAGNVSTLRFLPLPGGDADADALSARGYVPLPHRLRRAETTVSFYHGPLVPGPSTASLVLPADSADGLMFYDPGTGMFDASYAAAWEIGRLLALSDRAFATALYTWKRSYAELRTMTRQMKLYAHLPLRGQSKRSLKRAGETPELPEGVARWLLERSRLLGLPFDYLVADDRMLPPESLRFFQVDDLWVRCFFDGAFSLGRSGLEEPPPPAPRDPVITGILLRSQVVASFPDLEVEAASAPGAASPQAISRQRRGDDVLLCLFAGVIASVTFHMKPEALHLGVLPEGGALVRPLRGSRSGTVTVPLRAGVERVVDVAALGQALATASGSADNAATFAFQMTEGAQGIRFSQGSAP
jgi:hypothetical protein